MLNDINIFCLEAFNFILRSWQQGVISKQGYVLKSKW